ncbi:hypothetical protein ACFQZ4_17180 [Catellatospora coxensis]|uniref:Lipoprotein n=1 Tax=Catellatospora coxensis TaxID=310354 RepID=A0A8J3L312_9ACTN|nr:hypothetical protein [Catellatospora coxensis]GIG08064.1 hypothetical protein Cco03nite_47640 [Catellatospora coxensis]
MTVRLVVLVAAVVLALSGCSAQPDPNAVAAAKCHLPLSQKLELSAEQRLSTGQVAVKDLGDGRREVWGSFSVTPGGRVGGFVCVVAPDVGDKLRGLRVESLRVE